MYKPKGIDKLFKKLVLEFPDLKKQIIDMSERKKEQQKAYRERKKENKVLS